MVAGHQMLLHQMEIVDQIVARHQFLVHQMDVVNTAPCQTYPNPRNEMWKHCKDPISDPDNRPSASMHLLQPEQAH